MELYGLAPWVGAGTFSQPYSTNILFLSWVWRAKLIALNITCWDPVTGAMSTDSQHLADMGRLLNSMTPVLSTGSCAVVRCDAPEFYRDILALPDAADLPFRADSLDEFVAFARNEEVTLRTRLSTEFPAFDWTDPIAAAIDVIDTCSSGNSESKRAWGYYASILTPTIPTNDGPEELYATDGARWVADISRVNQILATPDDTANKVWRAELAYRLVVYREAVDAFDRAGL